MRWPSASLSATATDRYAYSMTMICAVFATPMTVGRMDVSGMPGTHVDGVRRCSHLGYFMSTLRMKRQ